MKNDGDEKPYLKAMFCRACGYRRGDSSGQTRTKCPHGHGDLELFVLVPNEHFIRLVYQAGNHLVESAAPVQPAGSLREAWHICKGCGFAIDQICEVYKGMKDDDPIQHWTEDGELCGPIVEVVERYPHLPAREEAVRAEPNSKEERQKIADMLGVPLDQIHRLDIQDEKLVEVPDTPPDHPPEVKP